MFGIFSKKYNIAESGILKNMTDCHSHILPGVDDGIQTMEESLAALETYEQLGVKRVWLTPHIMEDIPNTTKLLRQRYQELKEAYKGPIELKLSAENMIDSLFQKRLQEKDLIPYGINDTELLLETSYVQPPYQMDEILQEVYKAGYTPVLAHPERYLYMSTSDYEKLREKGVHMQLNLLSLAGAYGKFAQQRAEYLLENGFYYYLGSDIHNLNSFKAWINKKSVTKNAYRLLSLSC